MRKSFYTFESIIIHLSQTSYITLKYERQIKKHIRIYSRAKPFTFLFLRRFM